MLGIIENILEMSQKSLDTGGDLWYNGIVEEWLARGVRARDCPCLGSVWGATWWVCEVSPSWQVLTALHARDGGAQLGKSELRSMRGK